MLESFTIAIMIWLTVTQDLCHKWPHFQVLSSAWLITGFVTRVTRQASLAEQELLTLPDFTPVLCFVDCCSFVFLFSPLCCLVFLWILITPLVSSNSSCNDSSWLYIAYKNVPYFNVSVSSFTFGFQIFWQWAYQMTVISETRSAN